MAATIRRVDYFYLTIEDRPGEACRVLSRLASADVNLLAFSAVPTGAAHTQLTIFPEHVDRLARTAEKEGWVLTAPQRAFLIHGDDQLGALVQILTKLADAGINIFNSSGVTDGRGGYGYIIHVRPEKYDEAARVLEI